VVIEYQTYIRSDAWRQKRQQVIARAHGICERCGRWPIVNVHHLTYEHIGNEGLEDLLGVCSRCHRELHKEEPA